MLKFVVALFMHFL